MAAKLKKFFHREPGQRLTRAPGSRIIVKRNSARVQEHEIVVEAVGRERGAREEVLD